jgi:hypothetical protein
MPAPARRRARYPAGVRRPGPALLAACLSFGTGACRRGADAGPVAPVAAPPRACPAAPAPVIAGPPPLAETVDGIQLAPDAQARRARGLAAMDAGRFDLARQEFAAVLDVAPGNLAVQTLYDAATRAMLAAQREASLSFTNLQPTVLPAPPWQHRLVREVAVAGGRAPKLVLASERRNGVTDDVEWLQRNGLRLPEYEVPNPMRGEPGNLPPHLPAMFGRFVMVQAIAHPDHTILTYGDDYGGGRFVAVLDAESRLLAFFDFEAWRLAPDNVPGDLAFVDQRVTWAEAAGGVLYVATGHRTYAKSSKGMNAYLAALDLATGELLWRSDPLVAGAQNFVLHGAHILSGYGFTAEPDHALVLDRRTGRTVARTRVASGPQLLFVRDGKLYLRTYDTDYEFWLR